MAQRIIYDGQKAVRIGSLPDSAWVWYTPHITEEQEDIESRYQAVPWLWRAVELRAQAISTLPFAIVRPGDQEDLDTSDDWQNKLGFMPNPFDLLYLVESSLTLLGRAYLFKSQSVLQMLGLRYLIANSIEPVITEEEGLVGFVRHLGTGTLPLEVDDLVYFWLRDPFVEIGPPKDDKCPAKAALQAAGVLYNLDEFAEAFFKRGAIKATLLKIGGIPGEAEKKRIESWWRRVFQGIGNAWSTKVVSADTEVEVIGEGIGELADTELTKTMREDISTALGIPQSLLFSNAANFAVAEQDNKHFYEKTVVPEAQFIEGVLNEQLFKPQGLQFEFRPETLDVFQQDEAKRSEALVHLTTAGLRTGMAMQILGYELPPGVDYDDIDQMREEDKEKAAERMAERGSPFGNPQSNQQNPQQAAQQKAMVADLRAWRTKAKKAGGPVPFESDYIPPGVMDSINGQIAELGVDVAFEFLKKNL